MIADKKVRNWITWTSNYDSELLAWRLEKKLQIFPKWWCNMLIYHDRIHKKTSLKNTWYIQFILATRHVHPSNRNKKQKTLARSLQGTQQAQGHQSSTRQPLDAVFSRIFVSSFVVFPDLRWFFERQVFSTWRWSPVLVIPFYLVLAVFLCVFCSSILRNSSDSSIMLIMGPLCNEGFACTNFHPTSHFICLGTCSPIFFGNIYGDDDGE